MTTGDWYQANMIWYPWRIHGAAIYIYMVTWILSIYPSHVSIYTSTMDPSCDMIWYDMVSTDLYFFGATNRNNTSPASRFRPSAIIKRVTVRIKTSFKMSYPETRWFIKTNLSFKTSPDHRPSNNLRILMQAPSRNDSHGLQETLHFLRPKPSASRVLARGWSRMVRKKLQKHVPLCQSMSNSCEYVIYPLVN